MSTSALFKSFVLTRDMLAVALNLINRTDIGLEILRVKNKGATIEDLDKAYEDTIAQMIKVGLCTQTSRNMLPHLVPSLEKALLPLAIYDVVLVVRISHTNYGSESKIFINKKNGFTSYIEKDDRYILEIGRFEYLPIYILELFKGFHPTEDPSGMTPIEVSYNHLLDAVRAGTDEEAINASLLPDVLDPKMRKALVHDVARTVFRGTIQPWASVSKPSGERLVKNPQPVLMILQGKKFSWTFSFPSSEENERGTGNVVTREDFLAQLVDFLS